MRKIGFLIFSLVLLFGCNNEPKLTYCQEHNIGYVKFVNNSNNAYDIWLNDTYFKQQPGNTYIDSVKFSAGKSYKIYVKQVAGYILYPTEKTYNVTVNTCDYKTVTYP